jgi:hypothetical protein
MRHADIDHVDGYEHSDDDRKRPAVASGRNARYLERAAVHVSISVVDGRIVVRPAGRSHPRVVRTRRDAGGRVKGDDV